MGNRIITENNIECFLTEIKTKLVKGHPKRIGTRREDPIAHFMKQCDEVARKTREQIEDQSSMKNVKHYGCYSMKIEKRFNQDRQNKQC